MRKQKLELTWVGKDIRPRLEPRVLIEDPELSYRAEVGVGGDSPIYDNRRGASTRGEIMFCRNDA